MAVEPDQDLRNTSDGPPLPGETERQRTDIGVVSFLGAVALTVAVGMWFFTKDKEMIAGDGTTVHHTTGTRSHDAGSQMTLARLRRFPGTVGKSLLKCLQVFRNRLRRISEAKSRCLKVKPRLCRGLFFVSRCGK